MNPWRHLRPSCDRPFCPFRPARALNHAEGNWQVEAEHFVLRPGSDLFRVRWRGGPAEGRVVPWDKEHAGLLAVNRGKMEISSRDHPPVWLGTRDWALAAGPIRQLRFSPGSHFDGFFLLLRAADVAAWQDWMQLPRGSPLAPLVDKTPADGPTLASGRANDALHHLTRAVCTASGKDLASRLALEARILEWLGAFSKYSTDGYAAGVVEGIKGRDREALEEAARILCREAGAEHSLADLSRRVNLNEFKLKRGFRVLWKNTVFGYLREQRLKRAEILLREEDCSVIEVANAVGYANPSHFARAFKERFGLLPKAYQCIHASRRPVAESVDEHF